MNKDRTCWLPLIDDIMGKIILSEIDFAKSFIKSVTDYTDKDLEDAYVVSGKELLPNYVFNTTFRTDILIQLKNNDFISIELQKKNTINSMIKNEIYADKIISSQKISKNKYINIRKLTQIIVTLNNTIVPKKERVLLESYEKTGMINSKHKIMENYHKTIILDLKGEIDYSLIKEDLKGWVILFKSFSKRGAIESIKYGEIFNKIVERMDEVMYSEFAKTYQEKLEEYADDFKRKGLREGRKEGIKVGREEGRKEGINYANAIMAQRLRDMDMNPNEIAEITGIPLNKILSLKKRNVSMVREEKVEYNSNTSKKEFKATNKGVSYKNKKEV